MVDRIAVSNNFLDLRLKVTGTAAVKNLIREHSLSLRWAQVPVDVMCILMRYYKVEYSAKQEGVEWVVLFH